jgi:energy-coupling factor transporter ATP-binding protein EcfA2
MVKYKIADVVFEASVSYGYTRKLCANYEYDGNEAVEFTAIVTLDDIAKEKAVAPEFPDYYLECLALFRKLCDYTLKNKDGLIFHSSAIMVDGQAYLFTAPSGTGKSTHTRLWREMLGDKAVMINDDKPIIRYIDGAFYVYGTPWNGKHHLDTNTRAKVKAICQIYQAKENVIAKASVSEMLMTMLNQTIRPENLEDMDKLLVLIDKMLKTVDIYKLGCNISREAAELSYTTMSGGKINED